MISRIERSLVKAGERLCLAVSGGADSTALLLSFFEANTGKRPLGVSLTAVHVHHGLRGSEADRDAAFVQQTCERLEIPVRIFRVDTVARQVATGEGVEQAARGLRYQVFRSLVESGEVDAVATAHTLDDQAETVMMKMIRGAWTEGLAGIAPVFRYSDSEKIGCGRIIRPMLKVRRSEVERYLRDAGQDWISDSTNEDLKLMRNRVRFELMPLLRTFNPEVDSLLARMAEIARDDETFWSAEWQRRSRTCCSLAGRYAGAGGR